MSLDFNFSRRIPLKEIEEKTSIKVVHHENGNFLEDEYGNVIYAKDDPMYGVTLYGFGRNPTRIFDQLIKVFDVMFIDDRVMEKLVYEPEKYEDKGQELYETTMQKYGYSIVDGKTVIPEREEKDYKPYIWKEEFENDDDLPF